MESRWNDADAARAVAERKEGVSEALALRTYSARLLGAEQALVLHGGGNTSVKADLRTSFGETAAVLHVKGSGWDLATIEPQGHPAVRLAPLRRLLELGMAMGMTDERMVNEMRLALLDASAPTPSVEALLHASLPAKYVDHTHADAILSIADQDDGERICKSLFGDRLLWLPYVMPGFDLAVAFEKAWKASGGTATIIVLERHGVFTFGETAKESYERMIECVTIAERHAADRMGTTTVGAADSSPELEARVAAVLRGALATAANDEPERAPIVAVRTGEWILAFLERLDAYELTQRGCATPDHVIRTKPVPMFVAKPELDDDMHLAARFEREIADYARRYDRYFEEACARKNVKRTKLDPWPRVVLVPRVGILAVGKTKKDAEIAADIYEHTIQVITDAEDVGKYSPLPRGDLFDVEYWSLEQAKIKKEAELPLARRVAVVTGAASGIGRATAVELLDRGAHVVLCDRDEASLAKTEADLGAKRRERVVSRVCDVTVEEAVRQVFQLAARTYGGVDLVVSNAGTAEEGRLDSPEGDHALRRSLETNLLSHNIVASCAAEVMRRQRRGGCILFNASKSAFAPGPGFGPYAVAKAALVALVRQYAIDLARFGIRANAVNADRIRTNIFAGGVLESRARARGLSVDEYFRSNLLSREVTGRDVACAFAYLAEARATTGCVITVDGGNAAAFPR